uniref:Uncharacterized protein n=1 Tax=Arundo donax TaxID=35708 RepID=A0A0A9DJC7_ARUDO
MFPASLRCPQGDKFLQSCQIRGQLLGSQTQSRLIARIPNTVPILAARVY